MSRKGLYMRPSEIAEELSLNEKSVGMTLSRLASEYSFIDRQRIDESPGHFHYEYAYIKNDRAGVNGMTSFM